VASLVVQAVFDGVLPLLVAFVLVRLLTDPELISTSELRSNSLLMGTGAVTRPFPDWNPLLAALAASGVLLAAALVGATALAVPAGVVYGWSTRRFPKVVAWSLSTVAASLPTFFWAVALELIFIFVFFRSGLRFLPTAGFGVDQHLVLPALALGIRPAAQIFRFTATSVEQIRHADYVRTAIAKGLGTRLVLRRHLVPNAAPVIVAAIVFAARGALSSLVIVEFVYVWAGAGLRFVQTLGNRELDTAGVLVLSFAVASALLALGSEIAGSWMRPAA
jgi:peptide/nickel transport system permease protein